MVQPDTWPTQARLAANQDWAGLEALQHELLGGAKAKPAV
jgi:hypothetical protein